MTNEITTTETNAIEQQNENTFNIPKGYINTLDITTEEGKKAVLKSFNASEPLNNHVGEALKICDCITTPGTRKGRNGAPDMQCQNTYLIDVNGVTYFSQSDGVARSIIMFAALYPDFGKKSTKNGYIEISCIEQELPNGNTLKTLVPVD